MDKLKELKATFYDALAQRDFWQQEMNRINQMIIAEVQKAEKKEPEDSKPAVLP